MEPRSRETTPTKQDLDFIVDDGYDPDNDPTYKHKKFLSDEEKYLVYGKKFERLIRKAKKLGAVSLDYSKRKGKKYVVKLPNGKNIHFGSTKYADYLIHQDKERRDNYIRRAKNIVNKQGELTYNNPESANFWSIYLLWPEKKII